MAYQPISVNPKRCHGCLTCQLRCSLRVTGRMNHARGEEKNHLRGYKGYFFQGVSE